MATLTNYTQIIAPKSYLQQLYVSCCENVRLYLTWYNAWSKNGTFNILQNVKMNIQVIKQAIIGKVGTTITEHYESVPLLNLQLNESTLLLNEWSRNNTRKRSPLRFVWGNTGWWLLFIWFPGPHKHWLDGHALGRQHNWEVKMWRFQINYEKMIVKLPWGRIFL